MSWFKNLKVKAKMILGFVLVVVLLAVLVAFSVSELISISDDFTYVFENPINAEFLLYQVGNEVGELRRNVTTMIIFAYAGDMEQVDRYHGSALIAYSNAMSIVEHYEELLRTDDVLPKAEAEKELRYSGELKETFESYLTNICNTVARDAKLGDPEVVLGHMVTGSAISSSLSEQIYERIKYADDLSRAIVAEAEGKAGTLVLTLLIIALCTAVLSILVAVYISGLISKPLIPISIFMKRAGATGDISVSPAEMEGIRKYSHIKDEIGQTIEGCVSFVEHVVNISKELETVANGDLNTEVELLSDSDTMGKTLKHMINNLSHMFGEISIATAQVSTGSKQIADGAQSLAAGSTQQASSVEQLSSSISEIAQKTRDNADRAGEASALADAIKDNAEKGNMQMEEMMSAVKDINQASQSISKVIKVINDIAFQTNILALNAAVEAARAGQHGKGFAVVAEEVRNLAAKSAEAAKDTEVLIANSMEKAELGSHIAGNTAESLAEIVTGIIESSQIVGEIAHSSEEQSVGIAQINLGIDQVAQVVQQNSATAEESAAASEQMSGQADMLEEMVAQFRLKDDGNSQRMPPQPAALRNRLQVSAKTPAVPTQNVSLDFGKY